MEVTLRLLSQGFCQSTVALLFCDPTRVWKDGLIGRRTGLCRDREVPSGMSVETHISAIV